jgi:hypothetical protein
MGIRISPGRIGRWSASHPRRALVIWFGFVAACVALGAAAGARTLSDGAVGKSAQVNAVMDQEWPWGPPCEHAYVHSNVTVSSDPSFTAAVRDVQRQIIALGLPVSATTSSDRHSVLVSAIPGQPRSPVGGYLPAAPARIQAALAATQRAHPGLTICETGGISAIDAQIQIVNGDLHQVGLFAIPVTLLVLLLAFVSLAAALVPLLLGLTAVAAGLGLLGQISHAFPVQDSATTVILLIGLSWLPLFLFVILFGLSMDYHVFILSRIQKAVSGGEATRQAMRLSVSRAAGVIIATALVMVCVFALFGALTSLDLKHAGAGLAVAVLIDATAIRSVLLPAAMAVLGERNWYLPR